MAQQDFIVLKKRNRVIETYFTGLVINFQLNNKQWVTGYLKKIAHDSLFVRPFYIEMVIGYFGFPVPDTAFLPQLKVAVKDVYALPRKKSSFEYIKDGSLMQIGSGGYIALNVINNLIDKQPVISSDNSKQLGIAAAVLAAGTVLHVTRKPDWVLGKKYKLQYVALNKSS